MTKERSVSEGLEHEDDEEQYACSLCGRRLHSAADLRAHRKNCADEIRPENDQGPQQTDKTHR